MYAMYKLHYTKTCQTNWRYTVTQILPNKIVISYNFFTGIPVKYRINHTAAMEIFCIGGETGNTMVLIVILLRSYMLVALTCTYRRCLTNEMKGKVQRYIHTYVVSFEIYLKGALQKYVVHTVKTVVWNSYYSGMYFIPNLVIPIIFDGMKHFRILYTPHPHGFHTNVINASIM